MNENVRALIEALEEGGCRIEAVDGEVNKFKITYPILEGSLILDVDDKEISIKDLVNTQKYIKAMKQKQLSAILSALKMAAGGEVENAEESPAGNGVYPDEASCVPTEENGDSGRAE